MITPTTAADTIRTIRIALRVSQSLLARLSGVSRYKICGCELGDAVLSREDRVRIHTAFQTEVERLRRVVIQLDLPIDVEVNGN